MSSGVTLVCFAVKEEARPFQRLAQNSPGIRVLLTGMGEQNARNSVAAALKKERPVRIVTAGFAGGLTPELPRGTVVYLADPGTDLEPRLRAAGARSVRFYCSPRVVTTAVEKAQLFNKTKAEAVEMESRCIHELSNAADVPVATVRVILDTASEDLALDFNQLMTPDLRLDGRKLGIALLKAPGKIAALLQLQRQSASAAARLGEVLAQALL
jgi:nucleoside phosphorylase